MSPNALVHMKKNQNTNVLDEYVLIVLTLFTIINNASKLKFLKTSDANRVIEKFVV